MAALLQNMDMFDKMLVDYSQGSGSAMEEASKSANNLQGRLNALSNSWTEFVNSVVQSDTLKTGVNILNELVQGVTKLTSSLGSLGTIGLGAGIFAGIKNAGIFKTINDETTLSGQRIATSFTARKIAQEEAARQLEIDIQCLKNYEIECQKGTVSTETFATTMNGASVEAQRYASNIKNGTGSAQTFATNQKAIQTSMNETSVASKAAAVGINLFKMALNTLIFFAVIEGIQLLVKGIDNLILTAEEAEEKAESLRNSMQSFFNEVQSGQQTISSISDRFSELSKHVTETGENIDLTKDEYSEYLDICNQVKSIMPELVTGYTNEGNAIITLKDNVDSLTESYKENIRAKASAFVTNGDDDGNTIQSFFDDYKIFTEGEGGLFAPSAGGLWNNKSTDYEDYYGYDKIHEWLSEVADLSIKDLQNLQKGTTQATYLYALLKENGYELVNITEDNYEAVHDVLDTRLTSLEGEMATRVSNVKMSLQQMLYADRDYWDIDNKEALSAIDSLFSSVDEEFIKQNNLLGQTALQSFESNVIRLFDDKNTQQTMIDIYAPQGIEESIEDYSKRVNNAIKNVQDYAKENKIDMSLDFGDITGDVETLQKQYNDAIAKAKDKELDFNWNSWFKENSINTQEEIDRWNEIAKSAANATDARNKYTEGEESNKTDISLKELFSDDEGNDVIDNVQEVFDTVKSSLKDIEDLSDSDKIDLIQELELDADNALSSTEGLREELNKVANTNLNSILSQLEQLYKSGILSEEQYSSLSDSFKMMENDLFNQSTSLEDLQSSLNDSISQISSLNDILNEMDSEDYKGLSSGSIKTILEKYPYLIKYIKDESTLRRKLGEEIDKLNDSATDMYNGILDYEDEVYQHVLQNDNGKVKSSVEMFNEIVKLEKEAVGLKADAYQIDLDNFTNIAELKLQAEKNLISTLSKEWLRFYTLQKDATTGLYSYTLNEGAGDDINSAYDAKVVADGVKLVNAYNEIINSFESYKIDFELPDFRGLDENRNNTSDFKEQIDWTTQSINNLQNAYDKLQKKLENTDGWNSQIKVINEIIKAQKNLKDGYEKQAKVYDKEYKEKLNTLPLLMRNTVKSKIESGKTFNVEDFIAKNVPSGTTSTKEKYYKAITEAIDWYNKSTESRKNAIQVGFEIEDNADKKIDTLIDKYNAKLEYTQSLTERRKIQDRILALETKKINNQKENTIPIKTNSYQKALDDEYKKIDEWGLSQYSKKIKNGTIQSKFGNIDMDKRTIIKWSKELKKTYKKELASWNYNPEIGSIDTIFGGSERFGEKLNGKGWEVAFTPILPDGTFLSKDTVNTYIESILADAYKNDKKVTENELSKLDKQGRKIGNTYVKGIFAGVDDSLNYKNNGNKAETIGRLMHFSGNYGAVELAKKELKKVKKLSEDIKIFNEQIKQLEEETAKAKFDETIDFYNNKSDLNEARQNAVKDRMDIAEEKGYNSSTAYYKKLINLSKIESERLETERLSLMRQIKNLTGQNLIDAQKELFDIDSRLSDIAKSTIEWNNAINDIAIEKFKKIQDSISGITDESEFLIDLLSIDNMYDDNGNLNNIGLTVQALHSQNYDTYMIKSKQYANEIDKLNKKIANGDISQKTLDLRDEYIKSQRECILSAQEEKKAVVDLVKDAYDEELKKLKELAEAQKEALKAEKDRHDYQKSIADKTKEIDILKTQINELSLSDDRVDIAQRLKLEKELADKLDDLQETQYENSISEQEKAIDQSVEDYEKQIEKYCKDVDKVFDDTLKKVNENASDILQTLKSESSQVGYGISDSIISVWKNTTPLSNFSNTFTSKMTGIKSSITNVINKIKKLYDTFNELGIEDIVYAASNYNSYTDGNGTSVKTIKAIRNVLSSAKGKGNTPSNLNKYVEELGYDHLNYSQMVDIGKLLGIKANVNTIKNDSKTKNEILNALKKIGYANLWNSSFSSGGVVKDVNGNLGNWTNEDGIALVKKGESILTNEFTKLLPNTIDIMSKFNNLNLPMQNSILNKGKDLKIEITAPLIEIKGNTDASILNQMQKMIDKVPEKIGNEITKYVGNR